MMKQFQITRYVFGDRAMFLYLGTDEQKKALMLDFLKFCLTSRSTTEVQEHMLRVSECPGHLVQALCLTLFAACFGSREGRLVESNLRSTPYSYRTTPLGLAFVLQDVHP
jgi:hypothetical protein